MPSATRAGRVLRERIFVAGVIGAVEWMTPRMRRVRVVGPAIGGLRWTPGQHVRLVVNDLFNARTWLTGAVRDALRTYSVWDLDPTWEALDLVMLDHGGDSPGAAWLRAAEVGQEVSFTRPQGGFTVRAGAPYHLFAGEETASVAFGAMLRSLPASARVYGAVEAGAPEDHLDLPRGEDLVRVDRHGASAADSAALVEAVRGLDLPDEPGVAYLAGEARTIQAVRQHLVRERGWRRGDVVTKPFWTPGRRGMD
ncbi:NADPH-dependent ferric siderophore reductase [Thermocatellispora tengchongensis]|uniref:NADPH-dependent ferric siderophore reductase n=1 Tax=Thermocatellispora tengchongensis TaxID=1073253 RepID=A0A840PMQ4_9ACTN|nr:siderophore-interacting protein [Thermocatellispora tengchongensis]MBB5138317.1 NADPH-dependent ferric siderophore reductase [Thermocatellispora tengchongensis]